MKVSITKNSLSIPQFISTSWHNISSLQMKNNKFIVVLMDGDKVEIPDLPEEICTQAFAMHLTYLEQESSLDEAGLFESDKEGLQSLMFAPGGLSGVPLIPLKMGFSNLDGAGNAMQHDPAQANLPDIPTEILKKIAAIAQIINPESLGQLSDSEPHCNCYHCQLIRVIDNEEEIESSQKTEIATPISDEELKFQNWTILRTGDKLYQVISKLHPEEKFTVHLGSPIGCTCGKENCEHLIAVLKS